MNSNHILTKAKDYATRVFLPALNDSITQFHAVNHAKSRLSQAGYTELKERDAWSLQTGRGYFLTRNNSTIIAFHLGMHTPQLYKIIGCHTDSPVLKLAPASAVSRYGYEQVNVQTYGGGLWHTWFDRDLTMAGKVLVVEGNKVVSRYWHCKESIMKIPNLAIHLTDKSGVFEPNKEAHIKPILSTAVGEALKGKHLEALMHKIATDLGSIDPSCILDFDLNLVDAQPASLFGLHNEFISGARLDNLGSSLPALDALLTSGNNHAGEVNMVCLFDHEEVGSQSAQGADSNMLAEVTQRVHDGVARAEGKPVNLQDYYRSIRRSFLLSADMAHGLHPNYPEKHHPQHQPKLQQGIVIKTNANQRYMTDPVGAAVVRAIAQTEKESEDGAIMIQDFIVKNDSPCGSTIGPMLAAKAGLKTVDIGAPMLGMHSVRETCGVVDIWQYKRLFEAFFREYGKIEGESMRGVLNE
ncbi:hypothetical protein FGO68_gene5546 [Halteria grandinella]|uniref:aspartyl aminopeptidase n=1 Tax=Halteria grandinella TaxID=5974 RepID=A0A8J8T4Z8_HALGN|nr:hypothetical protein FGO68_gene5546 [Halteria grandinella]